MRALQTYETAPATLRHDAGNPYKTTINDKYKMEITIKKSRTSYDMIFSMIIIFIGIAACAISHSGAITLMGILFILTGAICWFILKSGYIDVETSKTMKKNEVYFPIEYKHNLIDAILNNPEKLKDYPQSPMNTMKVDIYHNEADLYVQLFEYIPCEYKPCTKLIKHKMCDLRKLVR